MALTNDVYRMAPKDRHWPQRLNRLSRPPKQLFARGTLPLRLPAVAVVGTRYADSDALQFAHRLAGELARGGCTILSGGAWGIDTAAHTGALAVGGTTVAVLATGLIRPYPRSNRRLFGEIVMSGGCLLTESDGNAGVHKGMFVQRNRLIAAMADAVVVVQAPLKSGALSTARRAQQLGIPVYSVPGAPWQPRSHGCLWLLAKGAKICTSAKDVLSEAVLGGGSAPLKGLGPDMPETKKLSKISDLNEEGRALLALLHAGPRLPDELACELGLSAKKVQHLLVMLNIGQHIVRAPNGRYALARTL